MTKKLAWFAAGALLALGFRFGQAALGDDADAPALRVSRLSIVDAQGFVCAILCSIKGGNDGDIPSLALFDKQGEPRIVAALHKDGSPYLQLSSPKGARLSLELSDDGPYIQMTQPDGKKRVIEP